MDTFTLTMKSLKTKMSGDKNIRSYVIHTLMKTESYAQIKTSAGVLYYCELSGAVTYLGFEKKMTTEVTGLYLDTMDQIKEYLNGKRTKFTIKFKVEGSELQKKVCKALLKIPFGKTRTYKEIAEDIGEPEAVRAVATAIGKNPISIIIPCHRVIGTDGSLRGYAGGIEFKKFLLEKEGWKAQKK